MNLQTVGMARCAVAGPGGAPRRSFAETHQIPLSRRCQGPRVQRGAAAARQPYLVPGRNRLTSGATTRRKTWPALAFAVLTAIALCGIAQAAELPRTADHDYDVPIPGSYTLPVVKSAADSEVLDASGAPLKLRDLTRGRVTVMSFIYTRCAAAKACPYATGVLSQLYRHSAEDPALAAGLRLISMSFDPAKDTPQRMADYARVAHSDQLAAEWRFLTTSPEKLNPILEAYGQAVDKKENPLDPTGPLNHTLRVFLIDREGRIRNIYSSGTLDVRLVLADVKTLLMESR